MSSRSRKPGLGIGHSALVRAARFERLWLAVPAVALGLTTSVGALGARNPTVARSRESRVPSAESPVLKVCADPNNLPFTNRAGEGFENAIASLVARSMGMRVEYAWWPERRGWVRNTLAAHKCDVAIGVPVGYDPVLTTRPYYRSSYVFVSRADRRYGFASLDDPRLRTLRIGLHWVALDGDEPPPAHALAARGIVRNIVGFSLFGNYGRPNPPAELIHAVARDSVDVAIAWGPLAGYFAKHEGVPIAVTPVTPAVDRTGQPFTFAIAMGVRRGDTARRDRLQAVIDAHAREIRAILDRFGVPVVDAPAASHAERAR